MFDSHFHYHSTLMRTPDYSLGDDFISMEVATEAGDMESRLKEVPLKGNIFFSLGAGPWSLRESKDIDEISKKLEDDIERFDADAIGEFGFDNYNYKDTQKDQRALFEREADIARRYNKAKIIHLRDADSEILSVLDLLDDKTIMHCYSSGIEILKKLLDRGCKISFAGNITYKSNYIIQDACRYTPLDSILYETDSPYLTPVPLRGKPNIPDNSELTLSFISELKKTDREKVRESAIENFFSLMGSDHSVVKRDI